MFDPSDFICDIVRIPSLCHEDLMPCGALAAQPLQERGVRLCGVSRLVSGYEIGQIHPLHHTVLFCLAHEARLFVDEQDTVLRPGEMAILPAGLRHYYAPQGQSWHMIFFHLSPTAYWNCVERAGVTVRTSCDTVEMAQAIEGLVAEELRGESRIASLHAELALAYLERELGRNEGMEESALRRRFSQLWREVSLDLRAEWPLEVLAQRASLSMSSLNRHCKRLFGMPPGQMVTTLRIRQAEALLRTTSMPVYQIAAAAGYENQFAFSVAFKRATGHPPTHCRQSE